jgi:hypothetical protein
MMKTYKAPWSTSLIVTSFVATLLCVGVTILLFSNGRSALTWTGIGPIALICCAALFMVRGYTVTSDAILVHRLFWATRLPLVNLESATFDPKAMRRSIRTFGNGGLFSFTGFYANKTLGRYRAFVTDPNRAVVLRFSKRTIVVSPSPPDDFAHSLNATTNVSTRS